MDIQKPSRFKRWVMVTLTVTGFGVMTYQFVPAAAPDQTGDVPEKEIAAMVIVAQSADQTTVSRGETSPSESEPTEPKTEEKKETTAPKNRKLKDFRPSEQIEAEQAVDFPYDI